MFALLICINGFFGCSAPVTVGQYPTLEDCKRAADSAVYTIQREAWRPFDDGALCLRSSDAVGLSTSTTSGFIGGPTR